MTKSKFDLLDLENGNVIVTKDGTKYVFINGACYRFVTNATGNAYDFIVLDRDGKCPKYPSGNRDVAFVYAMDACPCANRISEGMKYAAGVRTDYNAIMTYSAKSKEEIAAEENLAKALKDLEAAKHLYQYVTGK